MQQPQDQIQQSTDRITKVDIMDIKDYLRTMKNIQLFFFVLVVIEIVLVVVALILSIIGVLTGLSLAGFSV